MTKPCKYCQELSEDMIKCATCHGYCKYFIFIFLLYEKKIDTTRLFRKDD